MLALLSIGQMLDMIKTCDSFDICETDCLCDQLFNKVKLILSK